MATIGLAACAKEPTEPSVRPDLYSPRIVARPDNATLAAAGSRVGLQVTASAGGHPLIGATIEWGVPSGVGLFEILDPDHPDSVELVSSMTNTTGADGVAKATFIPTFLGSSTVEVSAATDEGVAIGSVEFVTISNQVMITLDPDHWDASWPAGPQDATVAVGTRVEWTTANSWWSYEARVHSTSVPPGGEGFDTSQQQSGEPFSFVPRVPGEWVWEYDDGGVIGSATLTAQ